MGKPNKCEICGRKPKKHVEPGMFDLYKMVNKANGEETLMCETCYTMINAVIKAARDYTDSKRKNKLCGNYTKEQLEKDQQKLNDAIRKGARYG